MTNLMKLKLQTSMSHQEEGKHTEQSKHGVSQQKLSNSKIVTRNNNKCVIQSASMPMMVDYFGSNQNIQSIGHMTESKLARKLDKFRFCCYEIEDDEEDDNRQTKRNHHLMLSPTTESGIQFSPAMRNADVKIYKLLEDLYEKYKDMSEILPILCQKRVNPEIAELLTERDDLEYYVPQLVTYMVVQCNLENEQLNLLMTRACMTDFYFAHSVYFYLESLSKNEEGLLVSSVVNFIDSTFLPKMKIYERSHLSGHELMRSMIGRKSSHTQQYSKFEQEEENLKDIEDTGLTYGTKKYPNPPPDYPLPVDKVRIRAYNNNTVGGFMQTPQFWMDLVSIGERLATHPPGTRIEALSNLLKEEINNHLPATVYIPFFTKMTRMYTILNVWEGRVFSTKERAPFSLWIELYRQEEEQIKQVLEDIEEEEEETKKQKKKSKIKKSNTGTTVFKKIYDSLSKPFTIADGKNTLKLKQFMTEQKDKLEEAIKKKVRFRSFYERNSEENQRPVSLFEVYESKSDGRSMRSENSEAEDNQIEQHMIKPKQTLADEIFSISSTEVIAELRKKSIYRNLKSWRMMHLMVKIGDDLRQEQFAMQLISKFQYIFQKQKVECVIKSYEVISLGPNYGLIQMLNDATTLDSLFRKIGAMNMTLNQFFERNWKANLNQAKTNFMRSLAGYSLVTYFLQVKDRHNGNIMLHRDGSIIHIDFGFFLSNAPGKGVELQKNCPFKLLTPYIDVLGSTNSEMFFDFRRLFYKGFLAILKNKGMILSLVKMMYKSHGDMMNCFVKGEKTIEELEIRLNPEGNVENFCYDLINNSLDNWRAKWYDKIQYFLQKIYY